MPAEFWSAVAWEDPEGWTYSLPASLKWRGGWQCISASPVALARLIGHLASTLFEPASKPGNGGESDEVPSGADAPVVAEGLESENTPVLVQAIDSLLPIARFEHIRRFGVRVVDSDHSSEFKPGLHRGLNQFFVDDYRGAGHTKEACRSPHHAQGRVRGINEVSAADLRGGVAAGTPFCRLAKGFGEEMLDCALEQRGVILLDDLWIERASRSWLDTVHVDSHPIWGPCEQSIALSFCFQAIPVRLGRRLV